MKAAILRRRRRNRAGAGAGLQAPTIVWDNEIEDLLPDFAITYDAHVSDIVTVRRTQTEDFSFYEEASDSVLSLDPPTELDFDFGGEWSEGVWLVKAYYSRAGRLSRLSDPETVTLSSVPSASNLLLEGGASNILMEGGTSLLLTEGA